MNGPCAHWAMTTSSDRVDGQPAYVLHSRPYKETSCLVDFLTVDFGRIRAVVKGVRRSSSSLREVIQPFVPVTISWRGRGELKNLSAGETTAVNPFLQGHSLWCGLYLNELLVRLLPAWDSQPRLFAYYQFAITSLNDEDTREAVLRVFEKRLLEELGFAISFSHCGDNGEMVVAGQYYRFDPEQGFSAVNDPQLSSRRLYPGSALLAIAADDYGDAGVRNVAKRLMRMALEPHLGDRPLRSRELFLQRRPQPAAERNGGPTVL